MEEQNNRGTEERRNRERKERSNRATVRTEEQKDDLTDVIKSILGCSISLATFLLDETSCPPSLSVLERRQLKSPPTIMLSLGNCLSKDLSCLKIQCAHYHNWVHKY